MTRRPPAPLGAVLGAVLGAGALACAVLAGCGGGTAAHRTTTPRPTPTATSTEQVPVLFSPSTVSFVSVRVGFALGVATCTPKTTTLCVGLARTTDGGAHWTPATPPPLLDLADPVHQPILRFASATTGFATDGRPGTGLLVTRDGGATWSRLAGLPSTAAVTSVATDGGHLLVVAGDARAQRLFATTVGGGALTAVGPALVGTGGTVDVAVSRERAYAVSSPGVAARPVAAYSSVGLTTWAPMDVPCSAGGTGRVAAAGDEVVLGCQDPPRGPSATKRVWVSTDAGSTFEPQSALNPDGYLRGVALGSPQAFAAATSSDTDQLQASANGGRTFTVAYASAVGGQGQGITDLAYVDPAHAFAVLGSSGPYAVSLASGIRNQPGPRLLTSVDGGAHWTQIQVRP